MLRIDPLHGREHFSAPPQRVFDVITDLEAVGASMPGVVSAERVDERTLKAVVRPGFSFISGQIRLTLSLLESAPAERVAMRTEAASIGVSMRVDAQMHLTPADGGTDLAWEAQVSEMKGLITAVPAGLVRAAAEKVMADGFGALRARVEAGR